MLNAFLLFILKSWLHTQSQSTISHFFTKGKGVFTMEKSSRHIFNQIKKFNITYNGANYNKWDKYKGIFMSLDVMHWEEHITNLVYLSKMFDLNLIMRKQTNLN